MNPGSLAWKAKVLNQTRRRPPFLLLVFPISVFDLRFVAFVHCWLGRLKDVFQFGLICRIYFVEQTAVRGILVETRDFAGLDWIKKNVQNKQKHVKQRKTTSNSFTTSKTKSRRPQAFANLSSFQAPPKTKQRKIEEKTSKQNSNLWKEAAYKHSMDKFLTFKSQKSETFSASYFQDVFEFLM